MYVPTWFLVIVALALVPVALSVIVSAVLGIVYLLGALVETSYPGPAPKVKWELCPAPEWAKKPWYRRELPKWTRDLTLLVVMAVLALLWVLFLAWG